MASPSDMADRSAELRRLGEAIWGRQWQTPLAQAVDVSDRTVRRWAAGKIGVPDDVMMVVRALSDAYDREPKPDESSPADWTVKGMVARHVPTGLKVRFAPHPDGGFQGDVIAGLDRLSADPTRAARMLREAGDAFRRSRE